MAGIIFGVGRTAVPSNNKIIIIMHKYVTQIPIMAVCSSRIDVLKTNLGGIGNSASRAQYECIICYGNNNNNNILINECRAMLWYLCSYIVTTLLLLYV